MYHCTTDGMGEGKKEKHQHVVWNMIAGEDDCGSKSREFWRSITAPQRGWGLGRKRKTDMWNMILSSSSSLSVLSTGSCYRSHFSPSFWWSGASLYCNRQTTQPTLRAIVVQILPLVPKALVCFYPRGRVMFWQLRLVSDHIKTPVNGDSKSTPVLSLSSSLRLHWENWKQGSLIRRSIT